MVQLTIEIMTVNQRFGRYHINSVQLHCTCTTVWKVFLAHTVCTYIHVHVHVCMQICMYMYMYMYAVSVLQYVQYVSINSLRSGGKRRRLNGAIHTVVLASHFSGTNALKRGYNGTVKLSLAFRRSCSRSHWACKRTRVYS